MRRQAAKYIKSGDTKTQAKKRRLARIQGKQPANKNTTEKIKLRSLPLKSGKVTFIYLWRAKYRKRDKEVRYLLLLS